MNDADQALVIRVLRKERAAFDEFFETYFARLHRFCAARMSDSSACEDVVQETLIKALRHLGGYRGEASLFTWLCQICRNELSNWYQRTGQRQALAVSLDDDPAVRAALESLNVSEPEEQFALHRVVQLTLDHLPDNYGKALEWKYVEGISVDEVAARLRISVIAAQSLLARARTAFRRGYRDVQQSALSAEGAS